MDERAETTQTRSTARKRLGDDGERLAATWLEARGYRVVARNWRCAYGEIDLIVEPVALAIVAGSAATELVFVEVKTRRGTAMGTPEEAITPTKQRRLIAAAQTYLAEHDSEQRPYCIDVVAVDLAPTGALRQVRHYPRCIEAHV